MSATSKPRVFIGSSGEGESICHYLQAALEHLTPCEVTLWTQGVFRASKYSMESLVDATKRSDFAILVATPDDLVDSRGVATAAARDNVIFELGLFIGSIGRERTFIVADQSDGGLKLPSDLNGLTWIPYKRRDDNNQQAAVATPALQLSQEIQELGALSQWNEHGHALVGAAEILGHEVNLICIAAKAQGWKIKTNSATTLRLVSPRGQKYSFSFREPNDSRKQLRAFANQLRGAGLRMSSSLRRPPEDSPF